MLRDTYRFHNPQNRIALAAAAGGVLLGLAPSAFADVTKADNTAALNTPGSYVENTTPSIADLLRVDSTLTANRNAPLGGDLSLKGIVVGPTAGFALSITNTPGAILTLGSGGIDASAAGANLTVGNTIALTGPTTVNVATGRTVVLNGGPIIGTGGLNFTGTSGSVATLTPVTAALAGTADSGGTTLTLASPNPALFVGQSVTGTGIAANTTITAISGTNVTLSVATTAAVTAAAFSGSGFSGGTTLNGGLVQLTSGVPTVIQATTGTGTNISAGSNLSGLFGTGNLTINTGTTIASTSQQNNIAAPTINVAGNFTLGASTGVARIAMSGTFDMGGQPRVITLNKASTNITSGNEILSIGSRAGTGYVPVFQNGTVEFQAGALANATTPAVITQVVATNFANNNGLIIGPNVIYSANAFGSGTNAPALTVNGSFYAGSGTIARPTTVYSLSGSGLYTNPSSSTTVSTLTINGASGTTTFGGTIANGTAAQFGSVVTAATQGLVALTKAGSSTQILTGTNTYTGATVVSGGTLQLGNGLSGSDGTIDGTSGVAVSSGATLAFNRFGNTSAAYVISGAGSVSKAGTGTQTLTGANTYTGVTTVTNGTLEVNTAAAAVLLAGTGTTGGTNVQNGSVAFTGGDAGVIRGLLATAYADLTTPGVMDSGTLRSSTATATRGLGYKSTGGTVTVRATLFGDADLDGGVSINDFNALAGNFGQASGKVWVDGDFDYDGGVSINDFNLLAGNFGQTLPASSEAWAGLLAFAAAHNDLDTFAAITGVPEPTSLGLIAAGVTLGLRRRRS